MHWEMGKKGLTADLNLLHCALNIIQAKSPLNTVSAHIPDPHHTQDALEQEIASCAICTLVVSCSLLR